MDPVVRSGLVFDVVLERLFVLGDLLLSLVLVNLVIGCLVLVDPIQVCDDCDDEFHSVAHLSVGITASLIMGKRFVHGAVPISPVAVLRGRRRW